MIQTPRKSKKTEVKEVKPSEAEKVEAWRKSFFMEELPHATAEEIDRLVHSAASPHDVRILKATPCPTHLITEILV